MLSQKEVFGIVKSMVGANDVVAVNMSLVRFTRCWHAGLILSQLFYWADKTKIPGGWICKTQEEWEEELLISEHQVRKAVKTLESMNIIEKKFKKFEGTPKWHYRIKEEEFTTSFFEFLEGRKIGTSKNSKVKVGESESSEEVAKIQRSLTETTETNTEINLTTEAREGKQVVEPEPEKKEKATPPGSAAPPNEKEKKGKRQLSVPIPLSESPLSDVQMLKSVFEGTQYEHVDLEYYHDRVREWAERKGARKVDWKRTFENWMWKDHCNKILRTKFNSIAAIAPPGGNKGSGQASTSEFEKRADLAQRVMAGIEYDEHGNRK